MTREFRWISALFLMLLAAAAPGLRGAAAAPPEAAPETVAEGRVVSVIDGDTVVLAGGIPVRLAGIQAPKLALGRPGFRDWPLADAAKRTMEQLALDRSVTLSYDGRRIDRWRRLLAQVHAGDVWLQREMLRRGLARVYTFADNRAHAADFYAAEREARREGRGIWGLDWYRVRTPDETGRDIGTFQLVEGTPVAVANVRGRTYVNYGRDWRTDFTVLVESRDRSRFREAGLDLDALAGRRIRVRGWLYRRDGAMIRLSHPEQIEIADPK